MTSLDEQPGQSLNLMRQIEWKTAYCVIVGRSMFDITKNKVSDYFLLLFLS